MGRLDGIIEMKAGLRPCIVQGKRALFHCWMQKSEVIAPSPMVGGHAGGTVAYMEALVEYEDGSIAECYPYKIKFVDGLMRNRETDTLYNDYERMRE